MVETRVWQATFSGASSIERLGVVVERSLLRLNPRALRISPVVTLVKNVDIGRLKIVIDRGIGRHKLMKVIEMATVADPVGVNLTELREVPTRGR